MSFEALLITRQFQTLGFESACDDNFPSSWDIQIIKALLAYMEYQMSIFYRAFKKQTDKLNQDGFLLRLNSEKSGYWHVLEVS